MWPFDGLVTKIQMAFSQASSDYNQVHQLTRRLEQENAQLQQQSVIRIGLRNMLANRYNGVSVINTLWAKGMEGAYWSYYFAFSPHLQRDVHDSAYEWARAQVTLPNLSFANVAMVAATGFGTTSQDLVRIQQAGQSRVQREAQFLAASTGASMLITATLKQAGQRVHNEYGRMFMRTATRTWQFTGVLAFCYGLGRIADAVHESGPFAQDLRIKRDDYIRGQKQALDQRFKALVAQYEKTVPQGWMD